MAKGRSKLFYGGFIVLECLLWGVGNPVAKIGLATVSPFYLLAIRFLLAFFLFMLFCGRAVRQQFNAGALKYSLIIAPFTAAAFIFSILCLQYTTATAAGFFMGLTILFTPLLQYAIKGQRPDKRLPYVILIVVAGLYCLCLNRGSFALGLGEALALLSAFCMAVALILTERYVERIGVELLSAAQAGFTALISLPWALLLEDYRLLAAAGAGGWLTIVYLAVGCTVIAYLLHNAALRHISAVFVSLALCSEPVLTAIAAFFLLGETLSTRGLAGAALIVGGLIAAALLQHSEEQAAVRGKSRA